MHSMLDDTSTLHSSRLVRLLSALSDTSATSTKSNLAQQLSSLISFGESERLAALHSELAKSPFESADCDVAAIHNDVLETRRELVASIGRSFVADAGSRIRLPIFSANMALDSLASYEPYHRFYAAHQRDFEARIQTLQAKVRDQIRGLSPEMAQLVILDEGLRDALLPHIRLLLAKTPRLLGQHFKQLTQQHNVVAADQDKNASAQQRTHTLDSWTAQGAWLDIFLQDMQGLLLAELELRLQPLLGLLEAVDEQTGSTP